MILLCSFGERVPILVLQHVDRELTSLDRIHPDEVHTTWAEVQLRLHPDPLACTEARSIAPGHECRSSRWDLKETTVNTLPEELH